MLDYAITGVSPYCGSSRLKDRERLRGSVDVGFGQIDLIDPAIEEHGGGGVQTGGDSLLVVFDSIDGTVRCAAP